MSEKQKLTIGKLAVWAKSRSALSPALKRQTIKDIWTDSRKIGRGDIFVALKTENSDGHLFVEKALKSGAAAAIVASKKANQFSSAMQKRLIAVPDPLKALQRMAAAYRKELGILMIGLTGSNGKTTTRNFIAHVLEKEYPVGQTYGNFNNHIGVPLSLLRFTGNEWLGIIEMGANHLREIHSLSTITQPDIALITNIGYGHIGLFGTLENTTNAKFEIVDGLNKKKGFLLINGDDHRLVRRAKELGIETVSYGFTPRCDIRATGIELTARKNTRFTIDSYQYELSIPGRHFVYSALPAIYLGKRFGIKQDNVAQALKEIKPVSLRGTVKKKKQATCILDCYNANPSSMKSAIRLLQDISGKSEKVAIVGDMLELGSASKRLHRSLGKQLFEAGVNRVLAVGAWAGEIAEGAARAGMKSTRIKTVLAADQGISLARTMIKPGNTVLIKGSRGVHLETVFEGL